MRNRLLQMIAVLIVVFVIVLTPAIASANAPALPCFLWFFFDRAPQSVQFVECRATRCEAPKLLIQYGNCTASGCLKTPPSLPSTYQFQCAETACLYREPLISQGARNPVFQLVAQFPSETVARSTPSFTTDFRSSVAGYRDRHFNITFQGNSLQVKPDEKMKPSRWELFSKALGIAQLSELLIALIFLSVLKFDRTEIIRILLWIGFVNLLTFPVAWFFFPSLQPFQYQANRIFGVFGLLYAIAFSFALIKRKATTASVIRTAIVWFFCLPAALIIAFIVALFFGYAEFLPDVVGIPTVVTLPTSELCVFMWEGWLLSRSQSDLSNRQAYLLSVLMNLFSFGLGLMLLPVLQQYG